MEIERKCWNAKGRVKENNLVETVTCSDTRAMEDRPGNKDYLGLVALDYCLL